MGRAIVVVVIVATGWASQYARGVMEEVIANRQSWGQLPETLPDVAGYVAGVNCSNIGQIWLLRPTGSVVWEEFLVVDCAGPQLRPDGKTGGQWMRDNNVLVEVGYPTAVRWGVVGRGVEVERGEWAQYSEAIDPHGWDCPSTGAGGRPAERPGIL